tara:strand:- start:1277 stop:1762 length:486 start_codon:yes stop_codon:yes gene_type:complete
MAISSVVKNFRDGTLLLEDGTGTPLAVTVQYEAGDFSLTGLTSGQKEITTYMDRGDLASVRHTNQTFPSVSFSAHLTDISDGTELTLPDIILQRGAFGSAVSTLGANADVYTLTLTWTVVEPGGASHVVVCPDVALSIDMSEGDPNSFAISGTVYGTIALT